MQYFRLMDDMSMKMGQRWHVGEVYLPDGTEPRLRAGILMNDPRPLHADVHHVGHVLEFCHTSFAVPIATSALGDAISSVAQADVQIIPVMISGQRGMVVLNVVRIIQCVSEQFSEFERFEIGDPVRPDLAGQYRHIYNLVLNKVAIPPDAHIFRIKDWEVALIVSEAVKSAMERAGCNGAKFIELEMA